MMVNCRIHQRKKGSFWWRDVLLCDLYRGIATCTVGNGTTVLFWSDIWNGKLLQNDFPRLFTFAKNKLITVVAFLGVSNYAVHFHLPLIALAHQEYEALEMLTHELQVSDGETNDVWHYQWGSKTYTSSKFKQFGSGILNAPTS